MLRAFKLPSTLALECTLKKIPTSTVDGTLKKTLTVSAANTKRFVISDHYEFDRKVREPSSRSPSANSNYCRSPQVINSENPVIVNFHAEWCDPCDELPALSESFACLMTFLPQAKF